MKKLVPGCGSTQTGTIGGVAGTAPAFAYSYARSIAYTWDATYGSLNGIGRNASRGGGEFAGTGSYIGGSIGYGSSSAPGLGENK